MRFSKLFVPTSKEDPKDAVLPSHKYLIRGGFIVQVGSGLYNFLPLGKKVLDKVRNIVKEELDKAGCEEVSLSFVTPASLWKESGRYEKYGKELLRFKDRKDNEFVLGPTHEEMMVDLVRGRVKSYKQLPLHLYQINWKFRDEVRPRFGLLRGREFLMEDGYSFHSSYEDMEREYENMEKTYSKIFSKMGLEFRAVEADSGAIGGSKSKEFMVLTKNGEDEIVICKNCDYAANIEAAKREKVPPPLKGDETPVMSRDFFHTPNIKTIEELTEFFKLPSYYFVKAVAKKAVYEDREEIVIFFIRGSDTLQETKALNACKALDLKDVSEEELEKNGFVPYFIGPLNEKFNFFIDEELRDEDNLICGGNKKDYHYVGFDFKTLKNPKYADLVEVKEGDRCPKCRGELLKTRGIEVGHIFQLGDRYSKPLNATFLDENGKAKPFIMGTYGIGVSRLVAVIVEQHHDNRGCIWTKSTAPYLLDIIVSDVKNKEQFEFAENLYNKLKNENKEVIIDDRKERFGFKMKDFELIGFPYALIVGKSLKEGKVQLVYRETLKKEDILIDELEDKLREILF